MPEIGLCLIEHGFYDLGLQRIYCGYYQGNEQSRRVQEKLGFQYAYTVPNKLVLSTFRNEIVSVLERKDLRK